MNSPRTEAILEDVSDYGHYRQAWGELSERSRIVGIIETQISECGCDPREEMCRWCQHNTNLIFDILKDTK